MTDYYVTGLETVDYESKKTGKRVRGFKVHCTYASDKVDGLAAESVYFAEGVGAERPSLRDHINILYNRYGQADGWQMASK